MTRQFVIRHILRLTVILLLAASGQRAVAQAPATPVSKKSDPRVAVERFFEAVRKADLKIAQSVLVGEAPDSTSEGIFALICKELAGQKLEVATGWVAPSYNSAYLISEKIRLSAKAFGRPDVADPESEQKVQVRLMFLLDNRLGKWLIQRLDFETEKEAADALTQFRDTHSDDIQEVSSSDARQNEVAVPERKLQIFYLKNTNPTEIHKTLSQLYPEIPIAVDLRTSSLLVRYAVADEDRIREIEEVLKLLDQDVKDKQTQQQVTPASSETHNESVNGFKPIHHADVLPRSQDVEKLKARLRDLDREAREFAASEINLRRAGRGEGRDLNGLRRVVEQQFLTRQALQRAELNQLQKRLIQIQSQIESREKLKDRIIDRRVEELVDPDLRWGSVESRQTQQTQIAQQKTVPGLPGVPAGVQQTTAPQALVQTGQGLKTATAKTSKPSTVQLHLRGPGGAWFLSPVAAKRAPVVMPARVDLESATVHQFALEKVANHPGQLFSGSVDIVAVKPRGGQSAFLKHNAVPIEFTEEDFDQVTSGNLVTKVIYLPRPEFQETAIAGVETLVSNRLDPGQDPIVEATKIGAILAIVRLGNRTKTPIGEASVPAAPIKQTEAELEARIRDGWGMLFFSMKSCPVCQRIRPEFTRIMSVHGLPFLEIDVERFPNITRQFRVAFTPTFVWTTQDGERGRGTGENYTEFVDAYRKLWVEAGGADSGLDFDSGVEGFLKRQLAKARSDHDSILKDIVALEIAVAELGKPIPVRSDLPRENREQIEKDNSRLKDQLKMLHDRIAAFEFEIQPHKLKIAAIEKRLKQIDNPVQAGPQDCVVWAEIIFERKLEDGTKDVQAHYFNGTLVSADGHIAMYFGAGIPEDELKKSVRSLSVTVNGKNYRGKTAAYDPGVGLALVKIDANDLPYLEITDDPAAMGRRLMAHATSEKGKEHLAVPLEIVQARFQYADQPGFFALEDPGRGDLSQEHCGAAILTQGGKLQGIVCDSEAIRLLDTLSPEESTQTEFVVVAAPANVIRKLLEKVSSSPEDEQKAD